MLRSPGSRACSSAVARVMELRAASPPNAVSAATAYCPDRSSACPHRERERVTRGGPAAGAARGRADALQEAGAVAPVMGCALTLRFSRRRRTTLAHLAVSSAALPGHEKCEGRCVACARQAGRRAGVCCSLGRRCQGRARGRDAARGAGGTPSRASTRVARPSGCPACHRKRRRVPKTPRHRCAGQPSAPVLSTPTLTPTPPAQCTPDPRRAAPLLSSEPRAQSAPLSVAVATRPRTECDRTTGGGTLRGSRLEIVRRRSARSGRALACFQLRHDAVAGVSRQLARGRPGRGVALLAGIGLHLLASHQPHFLGRMCIALDVHELNLLRSLPLLLKYPNIWQGVPHRAPPHIPRDAIRFH